MANYFTGQNYTISMSSDTGVILEITDITSYTAKHNKETKEYNLLGETSPMFEFLSNGYEITIETLKSNSNIARIQQIQDVLMSEGKATLGGVLTVVKNSPDGTGQEVETFMRCKLDIESETVGDRKSEVKYSVRILASDRKFTQFI